MNIRESFDRIGAASNIIGGICVAIAYPLHPHHATPEVVAGDFWLNVHILFALSLLFGVFGLVALFQRHVDNGRMLGLIGFLLAVTSLIGISGLNFFEALINPVLAVESPDFVHHYGAGTGIGYVAILFPMLGVLFLLGYVFFCWDMIRAATTSRNALLLTIGGTVVFAIGLSGFLPMMVVKIGSILFGAGLVALGLAQLRGVVEKACRQPSAG